MGLLSLYYADKANQRAGNLEGWVRYSMEWIDYLNERVIRLQTEVNEMKKIIKNKDK